MNAKFLLMIWVNSVFFRIVTKESGIIKTDSVSSPPKKRALESLAKSMCALYDCIEKRKYGEVGEGHKGSETLAEGLEEDYIPFSCHGY